MNDLTNSSIDRKNILNNNVAIPEVYEMTKRGIAWAADGRAEN